MLSAVVILSFRICVFDVGWFEARRQCMDNSKRGQISATGYYEDRKVRPCVLKYQSDSRGDEHATNRAGHAADPDNRADRATWKHVRCHCEDVRAPTLMRGR